MPSWIRSLCGGVVVALLAATPATAVSVTFSGTISSYTAQDPDLEQALSSLFPKGSSFTVTYEYNSASPSTNSNQSDGVTTFGDALAAFTLVTAKGTFSFDSTSLTRKEILLADNNNGADKLSAVADGNTTFDFGESGLSLDFISAALADSTGQFFANFGATSVLPSSLDIGSFDLGSVGIKLTTASGGTVFVIGTRVVGQNPPVPEPATTALTVAGAAAVAVRRRLGRRNALAATA